MPLPARHRIGYFRERPDGDPGGPSLAELRGRLPEEHRAAVLAYLENGVEGPIAPNAPLDVINPDAPRLGVTQVYADGEYCWDSQLVYYVRNYRVGLPDDFLAHILAESAKPARDPLERRCDVARRAFEAGGDHDPFTVLEMELRVAAYIAVEDKDPRAPIVQSALESVTESDREMSAVTPAGRSLITVILDRLVADLGVARKTTFRTRAGRFLSNGRRSRRPS